MSMGDTQFYDDGVGVSLRCTLCSGHIGGIETGDCEADSLQIVIDMYNNHTHECGKAAR